MDNTFIRKRSLHICYGKGSKFSPILILVKLKPMKSISVLIKMVFNTSSQFKQKVKLIRLVLYKSSKILYYALKNSRI
jgi:hypothetical protein